MLLKKIATGEMYVEQKYKGKNCTQCSQYISPTINQMLAALKEDSKLAGHYPHKQNGKWVIPARQTDQEENSNNSEKENKIEQNIIDNTSPLPCPIQSLGGVGGEQLAQENTPEKENKIEQNIIDNTSPLPCPIQSLGGGGGEQLQQDRQDENDNKLQQMQFFLQPTRNK